MIDRGTPLPPRTGAVGAVSPPPTMADNSDSLASTPVGGVRRDLRGSRISLTAGGTVLADSTGCAVGSAGLPSRGRGTPSDTDTGSRRCLTERMSRRVGPSSSGSTGGGRRRRAGSWARVGLSSKSPLASTVGSKLAAVRVGRDAASKAASSKPGGALITVWSSSA